ncbi:biotin carboxyl carrier protein of oxaloacetate decarboxylase [hydrocarbon metagenome]|uniref:Biotin carboxyl carrier protein of oxaloacetate decarboxylase n=1 Tax=hydrocarbon metagenome TaxID=938273 RepID=A0A0W8E652_9ZZZZ
MKYIVTINGKNYEVEVEKGQASIVKTTQAAVVPVQESVPVSAAPVTPAAPIVQANTVSGEPLKSPLPGTILDVKVHQGASVNKGDVLFILEAMKMETQIKAPRDGVVSQIIVAKGASVSTGDILLALQ